jgi:hypothetical protein
MYDVAAMKEKLENATRVVGEEIRAIFKAAFLSIYQDSKVPNVFDPKWPSVTKTTIKSMADLRTISSGPGLYVILSSRDVDGNKCTLQSGNLRAIYRGECSTVKQRVMSHLFHRAYKAEHEANAKAYESTPKNKGNTYYKPFWPHCLKLEAGGLSGIDVDQQPHSSHEWVVVVHRMKGSSQQVRQLAELAFDDAFGHPAASRDAKPLSKPEVLIKHAPY